MAGWRSRLPGAYIKLDRGCLPHVIQTCAAKRKSCKLSRLFVARAWPGDEALRPASARFPRVRSSSLRLGEACLTSVRSFLAKPRLREEPRLPIAQIATPAPWVWTQEFALPRFSGSGRNARFETQIPAAQIPLQMQSGEVRQRGATAQGRRSFSQVKLLENLVKRMFHGVSAAVGDLLSDVLGDLLNPQRFPTLRRGTQLVNRGK